MVEKFTIAVCGRVAGFDCRDDCGGSGDYDVGGGISSGKSKNLHAVATRSGTAATNGRTLR